MGLEYIIVLSGISGLILTKNIVKLKSHSANLENLSKFDGYLINNKPFVDPKTVEERKEKVDFARLDKIKKELTRLEEFIPTEYHKTLYRNLETLKIEDMNTFLSLFAYGCYFPPANTISIKEEIVLRHELFHLASIYWDEEKKEAYGGFRQTNGKVTIGIGLDEGYTDVLSERAFIVVPPSPYEREKHIAKLFELFFDDPKEMQGYYYNHNLPGFIHHMEQFAPREDIINTILKIDAIYEFNRVIGNSISSLNFINVELSLYEWFLKSNPSIIKQAQFERLLNENLIVSARSKIIKRKYNNSFEEEQNNQRKIG